MDAQRLGQFAFVQAVDHVEAVVDIVELLAAGIVAEHFAEGTLAAGEQFQGRGVGGIDLVGQQLLLSRQQATQALVVDPGPDRLRRAQAGFQALQGRLAAPGISLERLRDALALAAHRRAEFFFNVSRAVTWTRSRSAIASWESA